MAPKQRKQRRSASPAAEGSGTPRADSPGSGKPPSSLLCCAVIVVAVFVASKDSSSRRDAGAATQQALAADSGDWPKYYVGGDLGGTNLRLTLYVTKGGMHSEVAQVAPGQRVVSGHGQPHMAQLQHASHVFSFTGRVCMQVHQEYKNLDYLGKGGFDEMVAEFMLHIATEIPAAKPYRCLQDSPQSPACDT